jgi:hypothetical protein
MILEMHAADLANNIGYLLICCTRLFLLVFRSHAHVPELPAVAWAVMTRCPIRVNCLRRCLYTMRMEYAG